MRTSNPRKLVLAKETLRSLGNLTAPTADAQGKRICPDTCYGSGCTPTLLN